MYEKENEKQHYKLPPEKLLIECMQLKARFEVGIRALKIQTVAGAPGVERGVK